MLADAWAALIDVTPQIVGQTLGQYYNKKNMRDQAEVQYEFAERYANNSPSWNVKGLRAAGLNPILAVSNGVNLGANIPNITNSSPDGKINTKFAEALGRAADRSVNQQNADANTANADSNTLTADANMIRAKADAALKQAQTAETLQRTGFERDRLGQHRYNSPIVRDAMGMVDELTESTKDVLNDVSAYLRTEPTRRDGTPYLRRPVGKSTQTRHSDHREKDSNRILDTQWKTRQKVDGKPVYRKRGDVPGVMHIYR